MSRRLKTIVVLLMLALMPVRALATVTVGDCAVTQHDAMDHASSHEHGSTTHSHGGGHDEHQHCASASFVASATLLPLPSQVASDRVVEPEYFAAGFVPDHLDRPPLAL